MFGLSIFFFKKVNDISFIAYIFFKINNISSKWLKNQGTIFWILKTYFKPFVI